MKKDNYNTQKYLDNKSKLNLEDLQDLEDTLAKHCSGIQGDRDYHIDLDHTWLVYKSKNIK